MNRHEPPPSAVTVDGDPAPPDLSVVVPCYRCESSLDRLVDEIDAACAGIGLRHEIILVNDSSPDGTWATIMRIGASHPHVRGIDLLANHGQPMATMCGLSHASGRLIATMDDDLEHRPDQLAVLVARLESDPQLDAVVATWPIDRSGMRNLGSRIHSLADRVAWGTPKGFRHTAFRVMRRPVRDALVSYDTRSPVVGPMMHRLAGRVENVEVETGRREHGSSGFTTREGIRRVFVNFSSGSTAPLKAMSVIGLVLAVLGFLVGAYLFGRWALGRESVSGWLSVILALLVIGGTNLFAIGILGGYVDVIVREVRRPPRWSIRGTTDAIHDARHDARDAVHGARDGGSGDE